jgi:hypothetical protein
VTDHYLATKLYYCYSGIVERVLSGPYLGTILHAIVGKVCKVVLVP